MDRHRLIRFLRRLWRDTRGETILGGSRSVWGAVTGTLSDQTDLQSALDAKGAGSVTNIATDGGISGGPITTTGTISRKPTLNAQTGASYAIVAGDWGKFITASNSGAQAYSIAQAGSAGFPSAWFVDIQNIGAGTVTITPATSTINGAATLVLTTNQSARIISDGTNYQAMVGAGSSATVPGTPVNAVQFNSPLGTFAGSADLTFDGVTLRDKLAASVGPDESTLNAFLQGFVTPSQVLITSSDVNNQAALGIEAQNMGTAGIYNVLYNAINVNATALDSEAFISFAGRDAYAAFLVADTRGAVAARNLYGVFLASPNLVGGGTAIGAFAFYSSDLASASITNPYYSWFDSRGVRRVKEDNTFNAVGQAIEALYNPQFAKYTPGAADFERVVLGQWNGNVAEIGTEKGGTGTLRVLRLIGSNVEVPSINKVAITAPATSATLTLADGKTLTVSNSLTLTGTDAASVAFGAGGTVLYTGNLGANVATFLATPSSSNLAAALTDETGSGANVFANTPTLVTPILGVAAATSVKIGTIATIATEFQVASVLTTSPRGAMSAQYSTGTDGARLYLRKARGTEGTPTTVVTGDNLGRLAVDAYDSANYLEMAGIDIDAEGTIAATRVPTRIRLLTATDAAPSVLTEAMRINSAQNVGIGTGATISAAVHITRNGALSTGNGPALKLDGTWITGGSATTTKPYCLIEPSGATSANWITTGTGLAVNSASGFTGNLLDLQLNGAARFSVSSGGTATILTSVVVPTVTGGNNLEVVIDANNHSSTSSFGVRLTGGSGSNFTQTAGSNGAVRIAPVYNQASGTAANTDLLINRTKTAVGSGAQLFQDWQVAGSSKAKLADTGDLTVLSALTTPVAVAALPAAAAGNKGMRACVTDSNAASYTAGIGAVVAGGGSTVVPVFSDGTNWRIG